MTRQPTSPVEADPVIAAVLVGDPEAQDRFFRREYPHVYRLCYGFLVDTAEAEDVAQDAMLHLIDRLAAFDRSRRFDTWRNTVVANLCRDRLRRRASRSRAEAAAAEVFSPQVLPDPLDEAVDSEVQRILRESLSLLTDREREVFVLRDLEGVDTRDVALALTITEGTVRSLLCLARRRLRQILSQRLPETIVNAEGGSHGE